VWVGISLLMIFVVVACDYAYRGYVTPRISDIFENVPPFNIVSETENPDAERLLIPTTDGTVLSGSLINGHRTDANGLVLFLPELRGNHWMAKRYCNALIEQGYVVMAVDFRSQGESASMPGYSPIHWITEYEMADVAAMLRFIESRPLLRKLPLLVNGVSRGGVAALVAACRYPQIRGVVAESAFGTMSMTKYFVDRFVSHVIPAWVYCLLPDWHVDLTLRHAMQLSEKRRNCTYVHLERERHALDSSSVFLISGGRDSYVTPEIAARLRSTIGKSCQLWIVPAAKHNMSRSVCTTEYDRRVLNHFEACLGLKSEPVSFDPKNELADAA
jgi:pimeloyl-ACP methyl ester carboxylesterase